VHTKRLVKKGVSSRRELNWTSNPRGSREEPEKSQVILEAKRGHRCSPASRNFRVDLSPLFAACSLLASLFSEVSDHIARLLSISATYLEIDPTISER